MINFGHRLDAVKRYTPRQAFALLMIHDGIEQETRAVDLNLSALAAQGSGKDIKKVSDKLRGKS